MTDRSATLQHESLAFVVAVCHPDSQAGLLVDLRLKQEPPSHAGESKARVFYHAKREQEHASRCPVQPTALAATEAMEVPIHGGPGFAAAPMSPFQAYSLHTAQRSQEEVQRLPAAQLRSIDDALSWEEVDDAQPAPHVFSQCRGLNEGPAWRDGQSDGDTPRAVLKRPKSEAVHAQGAPSPTYGPLGEPHSSDDALSYVPCELTPAASPWQVPVAATLRATISQSSEVGALALHHHPEQQQALGSDYNTAHRDVSVPATVIPMLLLHILQCAPHPVPSARNT